MSGSLLRIIQAGGWFGLLVLALGSGLLIAGVLVLLLSRRPRAAYVYLAMCLLPLLAGVLGTVAGYREVHRQVAIAGAMGDPAIVEHGLAMARIPSYTGGVVSALLAGLGVVILAVRRSQATRQERS